MVDQFVSEGLLISDSSCDFANPLIIINQKMVEFAWKLTIEKWICSWNQRQINCLISRLYFKDREGNGFMLKWTICGVIISYASPQIVPKSQPSSLHGGWIDFWRALLACQLHLVSIKLWWHEILKGYYLNGAIVYIDDTVIYESTVEGFLTILDQILSRIAAFNVRLKP